MVSIDSSTTKSGIAIWENGDLNDYLLIDLSKNKNMDSRFKCMSERLFITLQKYAPNTIYIEETVVPCNAQTQRFLTRLQGVVYAWCILNNCDFNTLRPTVWRKQLLFKQGSTVKRDNLKTQAIDYVKKIYNIEVEDNVAEAIGIGAAALKLYGGT